MMMVEKSDENRLFKKILIIQNVQKCDQNDGFLTFSQKMALNDFDETCIECRTNQF